MAQSLAEHNAEFVDVLTEHLVHLLPDGGRHEHSVLLRFLQRIGGDQPSELPQRRPITLDSSAAVPARVRGAGRALASSSPYHSSPLVQ